MNELFNCWNVVSSGKKKKKEKIIIIAKASTNGFLRSSTY